jgi:hypothetical protein
MLFIEFAAAPLGVRRRPGRLKVVFAEMKMEKLKGCSCPQRIFLP